MYSLINSRSYVPNTLIYSSSAFNLHLFISPNTYKTFAIPPSSSTCRTSKFKGNLPLSPKSIG